MRSPSYPSTPLEEAIEIVKKLHQVERKNPIDREVAAKALGYSGITGRSATILSNLIQYGLLEKAGKNEVRVADRAVEIIYPHSDQDRATALREAAHEPELFQSIMRRFTDGTPSNTALEAFLVREGFSGGAIQLAIRAYRETFLFLKNAIENSSNSQPETNVVESQLSQQVENPKTMGRTTQTAAVADKQDRGVGNRSDHLGSRAEGASIHFHNKRILLSGGISTQWQAEELIATISALMPLLKANGDEVSAAPQESDGGDA